MTTPYSRLDPRCESQTGYRVGPYGFEREPCHASRGLRSFIDGDGGRHYGCPGLGGMAGGGAQGVGRGSPATPRGACGRSSTETG